MLSGDDSLQWGCSKCRGKGHRSGDKLRKIRNCDGMTNPNVGFSFDPSLRRCPRSLLTPEVNAVLELHSDWETFRMLPRGQPMHRQPHAVYDAIRFVHDTLQTERRKADERQRRQGERELEQARKETARG